MDDLGIPENVVIRWADVFTVDGEEFPWYITARGPLVGRLADHLYVVDVELLGISKRPDPDAGSHKMLSVELETYDGNTVPYRPIIGGVPFPYTCTDDVMTLRFCHKMIPTLHLRFLARNVDADGVEIDDQREAWDSKAIYRAGGDLIREGKDRCYYCREWVDDLPGHYQEQHTEHMHDRGIRVPQG